MPESTESKINRLLDKFDRTALDIREIRSMLDKDYISKDQLEIRLQPIEMMRKAFVWLLGVVAVELVSLGFFLLQRIFNK